LQLIELSPQDYLIINAGKLFTGANLHVKKNVRIRIWDSKVQLIEKQTVNHKKILAGGRKNCRVITTDNLTVIPGLIDCHVHLAFDGLNGQPQHSEELSVTEGLQDKLVSDLTHGIVAVRDGGDRGGIGLACRDMVNNVELKGPVVMASGTALRKHGGYGSFLGTGAAPGELAKVMKGLLKGNINQVKVLVSGIVSFKEYSRVGRVQFTLKELEQIVRIAADHGLEVMAHASSDEAVQLCINAGVHSIEHGYFISEDSLKAMADRGIAWVPTVVPVAVQSQGMDESLTAQTAVIEHTYRRQLRMIRIAQKLGVILGVGTDAGAVGVQHGTGYLKELQLYQDAGLTEEETLMAATRNGAYIIGMEKSLGIISPGRPAHLLVVEGDILKYLIRPRQGMTAEGTFQSA
jgi:imidazolonepropionase-like amidohydrolase